MESMVKSLVISDNAQMKDLPASTSVVPSDNSPQSLMINPSVDPLSPIANPGIDNETSVDHFTPPH